MRPAGVARRGRAWRAWAPGLVVLVALLLLLAGCGQGSTGPASADRPPASTTTTEPGDCGTDQTMGRSCPAGAEATTTSSSRAASKKGTEEEAEEHHGAGYELYEACEPLLKQSFPAYKACLRY